MSKKVLVNNYWVVIIEVNGKLLAKSKTVKGPWKEITQENLNYWKNVR